MSPISLKKKAIAVVALAIWASVVGFGMSILWRHSTTAGKPAIPLAGWPANAPLPLAKGRATLVMFAHPNCPCSRASIGELAVIMARSRGKLDARVLFLKPANEASAWVRTDLWRTAQSIPGVQAIEDPDGAFALRF